VKIGSANIATLYLGDQQVSKVYLGAEQVWGASVADADVDAFVAASGATDTTVTRQLVAYLKAQSLWANARFYPLKSAQNAGSGSTAYGLGGLTSNNGTLVNSPTWGAGGIAFALASSQYISIADFYDTSTLTTWTRSKITTGSGDRVICGQRQSSPENRSVWLVLSGAGQNSQMARTSSGNVSSGFETYQNTANATGVERSFVAQWIAGDVRGYWWNKELRAISLVAGSAQTARANVGSDITIMAGLSGSSPIFPTSGTVVAQLFLQGVTPTAAQREAITDLINAL
jgi:hypothetical protein